MSSKSQLVEEALPTAKRTQTGYRSACPFCAAEGHTDKKTSLVIYSSGIFMCFRCNTKGKLKDSPEYSRKADTVLSAVKYGIIEKSKIAEFEPPEYFTELAHAPGSTAMVFEDARSYLRKRGVTPIEWERAGLGACHDGRWAGRIIVPITGINGDEKVWFGWSARLWSDPKPNAQGMHALKYLYPPGMSRGEFFYNEGLLSQAGEYPIFVVEGVFDVLPFQAFAIATLGKTSTRQKEKLGLTCPWSPRPIVFAPDGDAWREGHADCMMQRFMHKEIPGSRKYGCLRLPPKMDPDQFPLSKLLEAGIASLQSDGPIELKV